MSEFWYLVTVTFKFIVLYNNIYKKKFFPILPAVVLPSPGHKHLLPLPLEYVKSVQAYNKMINRLVKKCSKCKRRFSN